jgi:large subunit ribosomal protein L18
MPDKKLKKVHNRMRRRKHIGKKVRGGVGKPRLVVYRSNKHIYAQIVDDVEQKTLAAASTLTKDIAAAIKKAPNKTQKANLVGKQVAKLAKEKKISKIVFDRGGYLYHGRVKALAEGAREEGLEF